MSNMFKTQFHNMLVKHRRIKIAKNKQKTPRLFVATFAVATTLFFGQVTNSQK